MGGPTSLPQSNADSVNVQPMVERDAAAKAAGSSSPTPAAAQRFVLRAALRNHDRGSVTACGRPRPAPRRTPRRPSEFHALYFSTN